MKTEQLKEYADYTDFGLRRAMMQAIKRTPNWEVDFWIVRCPWHYQFYNKNIPSNTMIVYGKDITDKTDIWSVTGYVEDHPIIKVWSPGA